MPFLPLGDNNQRLRIARPYATYSLLALCLLIFLFQISLNHHEAALLVYGFGIIPAVLTGEAQLSPAMEQIPAWATLISYQFLHGGWDHLIGNLLFLFVFADNVEDCLGHRRFVVFYLLTGVIAGLVHVAIDPLSEAPLIGASGAISGVLGAYLVLHPFARLVVLIVFVPLLLPAWLLLAGWFAFQFVASQADGTGPVAWWAHIGGFAAGALLVVFFRQAGVPLFAREPPRRISLRFPRSGHRGGRATADENASPAPSESESQGPWGRRHEEPPAERPRGPWDPPSGGPRGSRD
ncbi:MAG: rhomboid family intramembrane serine protease [Rhodospirillales bacterium]